MNQRISVIIPTYNRAGVVHEAIDSALAQTRPPHEIIVVDDGSKDDTGERLARYGGKITYLRQENQGVSAARNHGIRHATGELIAFLDSDDVWHPRKLELQAAHLEANADVGFVGSSTFVDVGRNWAAIQEPVRIMPLVLERVVIATPFSTSTVMVRKTCFDAIGLFKTTLRNAEDRDMYIRLAGRFKGVRLRSTLVWARRDVGDNLSDGSPVGEKVTLRMIDGVFDEVEVLRGRKILKRKAISQASFEASKMYQSIGDLPRALSRVVRSLVLWPVPFGIVRVGPRMKTLLVVLMQLLRLKRIPQPIAVSVGVVHEANGGKS